MIFTLAVYGDVVAENYTVICAVPARMLRSVARPCDHLATVVMAHLTEYAKSSVLLLIHS